MYLNKHRVAWLMIRVTLTVAILECAPGSPPRGIANAAANTGAWSQRVDIGGYKLYVSCVGTGSPTVILSSRFVERWERVQPRIGQYTRTCAYDRAGMGMSGSGHAPTSVRQLAMELYRLIVHGKFPGPFIVVGEGLDGSAMQVFANLFPSMVAGLVLVDAIPPQYFSERNLELFGLQRIDFHASRIELRKANDLGRLPVVVLSHGVYLYFSERIERTWRTEERGLARVSSNSVYAVAKHSSYGIPESQPELVAEAVDQILLAGRQHRPLLPCVQWLPSAGAACPTQ